MGDRPIAPKATELPSIFWGALGCVSVLGVGFTVLFLVARPGSGASPAVVPSTAAPQPALVVPAPPVAARPSPDIQPLAPPPVAPVEAAPTPPAVHPKPVTHLIKVARGPAGASAAKKDDGKGDSKSDDSAADRMSRRHPRRRRPPPPQRRRHRRSPPRRRRSRQPPPLRNLRRPRLRRPRRRLRPPRLPPKRAPSQAQPKTSSPQRATASALPTNPTTTRPGPLHLGPDPLPPSLRLVGLSHLGGLRWARRRARKLQVSNLAGALRTSPAKAGEVGTARCRERVWPLSRRGRLVDRGGGCSLEGGEPAGKDQQQGR